MVHSELMSVAIRTESDGERARLVPVGPFDLAHAAAVLRAVEQTEKGLDASHDVDLDLAQLDGIDGTGAVLLARLIDRLEAHGHRTRLIADRNPKAGRLITLYRERRVEIPPAPHRTMGPVARLGATAAGAPKALVSAADFIGLPPPRSGMPSSPLARSTGSRFRG